MEYDQYGYLIRCVELMFTGRVYYRGTKDAYANEKDAIPPSHTYTLPGARRAVSNLRRMYPNEEYCIERQSAYYPDDLSPKPSKKKDMIEGIDHAMTRLDELWNGNNFDNGDKMRINEVRNALTKVKEHLLKR